MGEIPVVEGAKMPTIWDELRRLVGEAEQLVRAEEQRYADLKAQYRELQAQHSELLRAAPSAEPGQKIP